ncbi:coatomer subunit zeta-2-like [Vicia villosa]|uniref:coatomer subunit zeta-2-like n=1 Tax=Vicia villosa TaxID=3911 RepID=UPI00273BDE55|nr:coatomer subunit zeta-2-like [Vicia villosa]
MRLTIHVHFIPVLFAANMGWSRIPTFAPHNDMPFRFPYATKPYLGPDHEVNPYDAAVWTEKTAITRFTTVEMQHSDCVKLQFGMQQGIPDPPTCLGQWHQLRLDNQLRIPNLRDFGSCPMIKNILLLDSEGKRVAVKYFSDDWPTNSSKLAFEKFVFTKTLKTNARTEAEITLLDDNIIIYKFVQDLHFFVTGSDDENEIVLASVLQGLYDAITLLLRNNVDKREALENLDLILLCLDEIVDGGMILETNGPLIAEKVTSHNIDADSPLSEQTLTQAWASAREHLTRTLLK